MTHCLSRPSRHHLNLHQQTWYLRQGNRKMFLFPQGNRKIVSVSTRKLNWSCHAVVKQRRHKSLRRRVTFLLPAHHINKDSTIWRRVHPKECTTYHIDPREAHSPAPLIAPQTGHPHPSQGIPATSATGVACSVYYIYGAAQAVALTAHAAGTPFDPRSLYLPSIGALVGLYHACLGFPVKQTWLDAIKAGNCDTFDGLTYSNAAKYCPDSERSLAILPCNDKMSG